VQRPSGSPETTASTSDVIPIDVASGHSTGLTDDQARFIHSLYALSVPTDEIACVMEVMRLERMAATGEGSSSDGALGTRSTSGGEAPPSYDFMDV